MSEKNILLCYFCDSLMNWYNVWVCQYGEESRIYHIIVRVGFGSDCYRPLQRGLNNAKLNVA